MIVPEPERFETVISRYPKTRLKPRELQFVRYAMEKNQLRHELIRKVQVWLFVWIIPVGGLAYGVLKFLSATVTIKP